MNIPLTLTPKEIMVIGETITPMEARKSVCMTGPATEILRETMQKVGLPTSADKVHYTVAVACAVPKKKGQQFPKEPMIACRARLLHEISVVKPRIIIVLGKVAFQTLTGMFNAKITEEYARPRNYDYCGDATVIPIMHPALIRHAPGDYKPFLASLYLVAKYYQGEKGYDTGETKYQVLMTEEDCTKALKYLKYRFDKGEVLRVSADIETTGLDYRIVDLLVLGICFEKNKVFVVPREMRHRIPEFFGLTQIKWTWHHGKYDSKVSWRRKIGTVPLHNDTIYMHYVLDETSAHDLGYLTKTFLQAEEYKYKMNQNWSEGSVTVESYPKFFEALCERVAVDCDYTYQLEDVLMVELNKPENVPLLHLYKDLMIPAANFLIEVEQNGMLADEDFLGELNDKYDIELERILREVEDCACRFWDRDLYMLETGAKSAPSKFNPGSPKQMAWMVFDKLKLKPKRRKGRSTDVEVLEAIDTDLPLIKKVLEYRSVQKEQSTYVIGTLKRRDVDGRVRSTFSLHITATGRLSSKEPNVQNVPSANGVGNVRRAYIPEKGKVLVEIDYSGAVLRWLAYLSRCPVLMRVFQENRNLHKETATALYGPHYTLQQKMRAKAVNFGIPYGREDKSFADEFGISMEEAHAMKQGWLDNYYGARDYLQWCADQVVQGKYLQSPWGNRRRFGLVTPETLHALQNEAKNFPIQNASSHLLLWCAIQLNVWLKKEANSKVINLIHDSMLLEVPMDIQTVQEVSNHVSDYMIKAPVELFHCDVPFKTDTDIGPDWGNTEPFNRATGNMELELDDSVKIIPYTEWIESVYHHDIYERPWYKKLIIV
jgi:DNA polymerase-1